MAIQSASLATITLSSSGAHPKRRSQFLSSIASTPSAPAALEIFYATHMTSSSVKYRGTVSGTFPYSSKAAQMDFLAGGTCVSRCFSQRTSATGRPVFVNWSSVRRHPPLSLSVAFLDGLPHLTRQYRVMVALGYRLILILSSTGSPALPDSPFRLSVSYQAYKETPLPEVHPPGDSCPDLPGPTDNQRLREYDVGKYEGPLRIPGHPKHPPPFCNKYGREAAPHCS